MKRTFCDKCGVEYCPAFPVLEFQVTAKIKAIDQHDNPEALDVCEYERVELCNKCAKGVAEACKAFIADQVGEAKS